VRDDALNILEVGVQKGGSTLMFAEYFSRSRVLGIDIQEPPSDFYDAVLSAGLSDRVKVEIVSQDDERGLTHAIESYFGDQQLNLVIDDASHYYPETRSTFDIVFGPYVKPGGTYIIEDWGCGYWPLWHDGNADGRHGLPRLVKELVDLLALSDRTKLWGDQRALPVESELQSPISRAVLLTSIAALVRSEEPMPSHALWWGVGEPEAIDSNPPPEEPEVFASPEAPTAEGASPGLRALLRQIPPAAYRAGANRWAQRRELLRELGGSWFTPDESRRP
jgi:SAM-dependent methyltransferase